MAAGATGIRALETRRRNSGRGRGGVVAIIDDYGAIAKRMRELNPSAIPEKKEPILDRWRDLAADTARIYAQNRRTGPLADVLMQKRGGISRR